MYVMPSRKKILYLITKASWGGAQRYVYDLATSLPKADFEVVVAAGGSGLLATKLSGAGIRTVNIRRLQRNINVLTEVAVFFSLLALVLRERPHILHVNSSKIGGLGTLVGRLLLVRQIIFTAHGWAWNEPHRGILNRSAVALFHWLTVLLAHTTIVVSHAMRREALCLPFVKKKIVVIQNGISPASFLSKDRARAFLAKKLQIPNIAARIIVGTIAELHTNKGIESAVEAARLMKSRQQLFSYIVIGDGDERAALTHAVQTKNLVGVVHFTGFMEDAATLLPAFDIFLLPSRTESFGLVLLEAGLAQLPVVASNVGGIPEIIEHGKTGLLVKPGDHTQIADALTKLIEDGQKRNRLGDALREHVQKNFNIEQMLKKTIALYQLRA